MKASNEGDHLKRMDFMRLLLPVLAPWPLWGIRESLADQWKGMSDTQKERLKWAYDYGLRYNLGESMRAICWQESSGGVNLENDKDGSYGPFGGKVLIVSTRFYKTWPNKPRPELLKQTKYMLIHNPAFAAAACVNELKYWQGKRGADQWTKIFASYNAGWKWRNGLKYAADIGAKIRFLRGLK